MKNFKLDSDLKRTPGFTTPDNYFEDFENKVIPKLAKKHKVFSLNKNWTLAAAAILIVTLSITLTNKLNVASSAIDSVSLENYIDTHATISEDELVNLLDEKDIEILSIDINLEDKAIEETLLQNTNLEQYLIN